MKKNYGGTSHLNFSLILTFEIVMNNFARLRTNPFANIPIDFESNFKGLLCFRRCPNIYVAGREYITKHTSYEKLFAIVTREESDWKSILQIGFLEKFSKNIPNRYHVLNWYE